MHDGSLALLSVCTYVVSKVTESQLRDLHGPNTRVKQIDY